MDQRPSSISQDLRDISQTRAAMSEKLERIEERVQETVQDAKTTVLDIVDHVKDTAESFVDRAEEFVEHTKQTLDPTHQISRHPWAILGGAIVAGYILGTIESRQTSGRPVQRRLPYSGYDQSSRSRSTEDADQGNMWDGIVREVQQEVEHTKGALLEVGRSFVRDFIQQVLPTLLASSQGRRTKDSGYPRTSYGEKERSESDFSRPTY